MSKVPHICSTNTPESALHFSLWPIVLKWQFTLWQKCPVTKMTLNTTRSKVPHICNTNFQSPKFQSASLHGPQFSSYTPLWPPNYLEHYKVNGTPIYHLVLPLSLNLQSISLRVKGTHTCDTTFTEFQISICFDLQPEAFSSYRPPNDSKITLNTKRLKVPHISSTSTPDS